VWQGGAGYVHGSFNQPPLVPDTSKTQKEKKNAGETGATAKCASCSIDMLGDLLVHRPSSD